MSWGTIQALVVTGEEQDVDKAVESYIATQRDNGYPLAAEAEEQAREASRVAQEMLKSGALGRGTFNVNLSGHANPDHTKTPGYANDCITIHVSVNTYAGEGSPEG